MDPKHIEHELKNYKLREATLQKRSKFLKEWRERWVVVTQNYLFTFKSATELAEPTDILDLRQIDSIKSYVKRFEDREISTFKLASEDTSIYFRCRTLPEKWSWVVFFERLLEHKNNGSNNFNDYESIRKGGFMSVEEYESRKVGGPVKIEQIGNPGVDLGKILKAEQKSVEDKAAQIKRAEDQAFRVAENARRAQEEATRREAQDLARKAMEHAAKEEALKREKEEELKRQESKKSDKTYDPQIDSNFRKVSDLKNMFQKKIEESTAGKFLLSHTPLSSSQIKKESKEFNSVEEVNKRRSTIVGEMFNEFTMKSIDSFKYISEFLVEVTADDKTGFASHVIYQSKFHQAKQTFAEIFVENYTEAPTEEKARTMLSFLHVVYFECPNLFTEEQAKQIKKCLIKFLSAYRTEQVLAVTLKTILTIHNTYKFEPEEMRKNADVIRQLQGSKSGDVADIGRKAKETFGISY